MKILVCLLAAALLAACAPPHVALRPQSVADNSDAEVERGSASFQSKDKIDLFEQWWKPRSEHRGVLVVVHGLKDHSSRYGDLAQDLAHKGIAVYAFDLRGHGRSAGRRVAVEHFEDYVDDLEQFMAMVREREAGLPLFLLGHSMGGAIVSNFVATRDPRPDGLILSGPALALDLFPLTVAMSVWIGDLLPNLPALKLPNENFSRDKATVKAIGKDPLVYQNPGPARTASELGHGISVIWKHVNRFDIPMLLMHGSKDKLTAPYGSVELSERAPSKDKTLKIYDGLYHDLLHEPERQQVLSELSEWITSRIEKE